LSTLKNRATTETIPIDSAFLVISMNDTIINNNHLLSGNSLNLSNEIVIIRRFGSGLDILTVLIIALMFILCTFSIYCIIGKLYYTKTSIYLKKKLFYSNFILILIFYLKSIYFLIKITRPTNSNESNGSFPSNYDNIDNETTFITYSEVDSKTFL
jgi:hypothetical protein